MRKSFLAFLVLLLALPLVADEGMWLFNRTPNAIFKQRYNFVPTQAWLDHLQKSSIRFNSGGSGSFVSADGLALTNHHVGLDCLAKISTKGHDYVTTGYYAKTQADEVKCVDLELNVLQSIEDVTARVNASVTPGMTTAAAQAARRGVMSAIEQESVQKTGLRSDVVTLFQGGEYHLYRYKKYTDVRLVFAPEVGIAFFGGDPDNFEYPRYDLDVCFFRAYENGKPVHPADYLKWSASGAKDGDLVFVSGHPGSTSRLNTLTHLQFFRDVAYPFTLTLLRRREVLLTNYAQRSIENDRRAHDDLFGVKNSRKAYLGRIAGLQDPAVLKAKADSEAAMKQKVAADPQLSAAYGDAWQNVDAAIATYRPIYTEFRFVEGGLAFNSALFQHAKTLLRLADESAKPNGERLREYRESNMPSLKQGLYSEAPIYEDLETVTLADSLSNWLEVAPNDPLVQQVLAGKSPQERASELVRATKLRDVAARKALGEGGKAAVDASTDPMIQVARMVDGRARELRKQYDDNIAEVLRQSYAKIANAQFKTSGGDTYPDATFTLRLSYGTVKGYTENGKTIPSSTMIGDTFEHAAEHGNEGEFKLPKSWMEKKTLLDDDKTPYNFVMTADIIGGNSGSPVVNRENEFVGIIFDGNIQSLVLDFAYSDVQARAVSVDSRGIVEALKKVYGADALASELNTGKRGN
ncbi:MAG TPA: S46 family peptidase, partial [Thermoanaerobaculia bacterium]|nr:S46 family peptidase [Thermoanaerobaculia bacterium]